VLVGRLRRHDGARYPSTVPVSLDEMLMLASAVRRGCATPLLIGDLPFGSYEASDEQAFPPPSGSSRRRLCAVKLEAAAPASHAPTDRARRHPVMATSASPRRRRPRSA